MFSRALIATSMLCSSVLAINGLANPHDYLPTGSDACGYIASGGGVSSFTTDGKVFYASWGLNTGGSACGKCATVTGPNGTINIMVNDLCQGGVCNNKDAFDIEYAGMIKLFGTKDMGQQAIQYTWSKCNVDGDIAVTYYGDEANIYVVPIRSTQFINAASIVVSGRETACERQTGNGAIWHARPGVKNPEMRFTADSGAIVTASLTFNGNTPSSTTIPNFPTTSA